LERGWIQYLHSHDPTRSWTADSKIGVSTNILLKGKVQKPSNKHKQTAKSSTRKLEITHPIKSIGIIHGVNVLDFHRWQQCENTHQTAENHPSNKQEPVLQYKGFSIEQGPESSKYETKREDFAMEIGLNLDMRRQSCFTSPISGSYIFSSDITVLRLTSASNNPRKANVCRMKAI
jgi:hypothetical protein